MPSGGGKARRVDVDVEFEAESAALPPSEVSGEELRNLHLAPKVLPMFHPQIDQHRLSQFDRQHHPGFCSPEFLSSCRTFASLEADKLARHGGITSMDQSQTSLLQRGP